MIDSHVHNARCGHASGRVGEYVDAARAAGLSIVTFTDHLPMPAGYPQHYTMRHDELEDYIAEVRGQAALSAAQGGPEVLCGVEADWLPGHVEWTRDLLSGLELDVVLGSVHFIEDWAFDDPDLIERYGAWEIDALWDRYFSELASAARSGLFDVMAHPDLVKKFGFRPESDSEPWFENVAWALAQSGCAVEVSTGGLRKPVGEIYPALGLLKACRRRGVPATTGSDAHAPGEVGYAFDRARTLLREAGYDSLVVYRNRVAEEVAL